MRLLRIAAASLCTFFIIGGLITLLLWLRDVHKDRKHLVTINSPTPIFEGNGSGTCGGARQSTAASRGTVLRVRRIRYWKNCTTLDVTLPDGRNGFIVLDERQTVNPDLP